MISELVVGKGFNTWQFQYFYSYSKRIYMYIYISVISAK